MKIQWLYSWMIDPTIKTRILTANTHLTLHRVITMTIPQHKPTAYTYSAFVINNLIYIRLK